ncbi:choice-of-anchor D domain-containing protein, partial [Haloferula sp. A504]|uniref:choice-of-anchor D domain-containing protein n=1 Tax=Haloferula sp. A504 TaxID=3373601 RepID=UPI0031C4121D|nr:choice-of-anchor D domain-containing protein [Verrucomicrobiaceae bacterium E54]
MILLVGLAAARVSADVNVLIIGSAVDSGDTFTNANSDPFSPAGIATHLDNILSGAGVGAVNVTVEERFATATTVLGHSTRCHNLAGWYHWPFPADVETTTRWPNLRGELGTAWDYVILIGDPYTMEYTPGLYALGVAEINEEVAQGTAQTMLLMPWPAPGSASTVAHYEEVVYRTGRSGGIPVAPAGLAWQAAGSPTGGGHPNNDAAYIAAATIYSRMYGQSASNSSYSHNDAHADLAHTTVTDAMAASHYSGQFSFQNPYSILGDSRRDVHFSEQGTSTEEDIRLAVGYAMDRCRVTNDNWSYNDKYNSETPEDDGLGWPTDREMPIAFNEGRTFEAAKSYKVNPAYWQLAFGYRYHFNTWGRPVDLANDHYIGQMFVNDNDQANRMLGEGPTARNLPMRTLWAQIHKLYPTWNPQRDGTGPHLNANLSRGAIGDYMYTIYSGRCSIDPSLDPESTAYKMQKIGYETAWRLGRCQVRAPGFKVLPTSATATDVTPETTQTLSVRFMFPPQADVTVSVVADDRFAGLVSPGTLIFTPANYDTPQTVTVTGQTGAAGTHPFNIVFNTSSADPVYDLVSDSWGFSNTRDDGPAPGNLQVYGNGNMVISGDTTPEAGNGTDFGDVAVAAGPVAQQFTISNLGAVTVSLTSTPAVSLTGGDGYFTLSQDAADTTLSPSESTTFEVTYNPAVSGTHTASIEIDSDDPDGPLYTFSLVGVGMVPPTVANGAASPVSNKTARLNGTVSGDQGDVTVYWGPSDGGQAPGSWQNSVALARTSGAFFTDISGLAPGQTYYYNCHVENVAGTDWADGGSVSFTTTTESPIFATTILPQAIINQSYSQSLIDWEIVTDADLPLDTLTFSKVSGPTWVSVGSDGIVSGTPPALGSFDLTINVEDVYGNSTQETTTIEVLDGLIIFSDNFNDLVAGSSATADLLNGANGNPVRSGQIMPLGFNTWSQSGNIQESSIDNSALFMGWGGLPKYTAHFTETPLSDSEPIVVSMMYFDRASNRVGRQIQLRDANGTVIVQLGGNNTHPYVITDGSNWSVPVNWGDGNTFRKWEFTLYAGTYDLWIDADDDDVKDAGEFFNGVSYGNAPTAGLNRLSLEQYYNHSDRGAHSVDDIVVRKAVTGPSYTVTFVEGDHGTRTGGGELVQTVFEGGAAVAPTITPDLGWSLDGWDVAFDNVTSDLTVTAQYSAVPTYTVAFVEGAHGTRTGGGDLSQIVNEGTAAVAPVITPDAGWSFDGWDTAFDNVTSDLTVAAQYSPVTYTLTYTAGAGGAIDGTSPQTVGYNGTGTAVTAVPDANHHFVDWSDSSTANPRTDSDVTADLSVTANFAIDTYTVTFLEGANGSISGGTAVQIVNHGSAAVAPNITPDTGWMFTGWDTAFANVTTDLTVTAQYEPAATWYSVATSGATLVDDSTADWAATPGGSGGSPSALPVPGDSDTWVVQQDLRAGFTNTTWHGATTRVDGGDNHPSLGLLYAAGANLTLQDVYLNGGGLNSNGHVFAGNTLTVDATSGGYVGTEGGGATTLDFNAITGAGTLTSIGIFDRRLDPGSGGGAAIAAGTDLSGFTG